MDFSLLGLWSQMGAVAKTVVILLLVMSMYAIGIALERFVTFRRGRRRSIEYIAALQPLLSGRGRFEEASALQANWKDAPVARIVGAGLSEFNLGLKELGSAADDAVELELLIHGVGRSMERAKKREMAGLSRGLPVLATISSSAPFVGLFGTVFGIITAFQQMADPAKGGGGGLATVSAGISEALLTTAVGLAVAIGAVWFYNFFTTRLEDIANLIDQATGELADRLLHSSRRAGRAEPHDTVPRPVSA
jgi:biopolymer transport protein ExbB